MIKLAFALLAAAVPAFASLADSAAYQQANQLTPLTSEFVYDGNKTPSAAPAVLGGDARRDAAPLRKGPGAPEAMREPASPMPGGDNDNKGGSLLSSPLVMVGGGAALGGLVGYFAKGTILGFTLKGGMMGGLIGAAIGAAIGFLVMKFL